jgi:uncharacterized protein YbjT (DUF2867 family)
MMIITGVTGHVGSVAAESLLAQGKKVRAVVRDAKKGDAWKAKGADVAVADLGDAAALARAFVGAEGAFVLLPPNMATDDPVATNQAVADAIFEAATAVKLPHVVLLSSVGAQFVDGTGMIKTVHYAEEKLRGTGASVTAVRAAYFMENHAMALSGLAQGKFPTFIPPEIVFPQVATKDIGVQVAKSLVEGGRGFQIIELKGPRDYSIADTASALSTIVGKPLEVQQAPVSAIEPALVGMGFKPKLAALYHEMIAGFASGRVAYDGTGRVVRGATPLEEVLRQLLGR